MAIFITGDTHSGIDIKKLYTKYFKKSKKLSKQDYVVVLGDFGIWNTKRSHDFVNWLDTMKPFTTLFVEGNHEDYNYLKTFPIVDMFGGKVRKINDSVFQLLRGEVYEIDKYTVFSFGGARSIDRFSSCLQEGIEWFPEEESNYEEEVNALKNLEKFNNKVDVILTHTCAKSTLEELARVYNFYIEGYDSQNKFFEELKGSIDFDLWCFGHMHKDFRISNKEVAVFNDVHALEDLLDSPDDIEPFSFTNSK